MSNFERAFTLVVGAEGGYVNHPDDPGGRTIYGITERDHPDLWTDGPPTLDQAHARYRTGYWDTAHCDALPWPLCALVFDAAVNQGPETAVVILQRTAKTVQDGILGKNTLTAIAKAEQKEFCALYLANRALRYTGTRNFDTFGRGWFKRLFVLAADV